MSLARLLTVAALAVPAALLPALPAHAACGAGDVTVQFAGFQPDPKKITPGTTVTWCWAEDNHSVTFDLTNDSQVQNTGATYSRTFSTVGTYAYHCKIHSSMQGTVQVATATTPPATHSPTPTHTTQPPPPPPATSRPAATTPPASRPPTPSRTPTKTPAPTSAPPRTTPTTAPTTAPASAVALPSPSTVPAAAPGKPRTGLAVGLGLLVAAGLLGAAGWLFVRGR